MSLAFHVAVTAECTQPYDGKKKSFAEMWQSNFAAGENAYIVEIKDGVAPHRPQGDGQSLFSYCLPKGSDGNVLNPFIETKLHKSMFWQFGKRSTVEWADVSRSLRVRSASFLQPLIGEELRG